MVCDSHKFYPRNQSMLPHSLEEKAGHVCFSSIISAEREKAGAVFGV